MTPIFKFFFLIGLQFFYLNLHLNAAAPSSQNSRSPKEVWENLELGNKKFIESPKYARDRAKVAHRQDPNAVILGCSDSRVPPEIIFYKPGLGEMFVVRTAGNVADDADIDSIEYTLGHHDTKLLIVLGHSDCGAVTGALDHLKRNGGKLDPSNGHLNAVLIPIEKAILDAKINIYAHDALEQSVRANIHYVAQGLMKNSLAIRHAVNSGRIALIGAEYNLKSGKVKKHFVIGHLSDASSSNSSR